MKVLLAVDGSPHSDAAIDELARQVWPPGTQVLVLTVVHASAPIFPDPALVLTAGLAMAGRASGVGSSFMFLAFTFLMVLVWMRLAAPDLALAEVAVGGAVMSVVLLDVLGRARRRRGERSRDE